MLPWSHLPTNWWKTKFYSKTNNDLQTSHFHFFGTSSQSFLKRTAPPGCFPLANSSSPLPQKTLKHFLNEHKGSVILIFITTLGYLFTSYRLSRTVHCLVCFVILSHVVIGSTVCRWLSRECNVTAKPYLAHFSSGDPHLHPAWWWVTFFCSFF